MNTLARIGLIACRLAVGALFIFSGFIKAIDPLGSTYKFVDYFEAFHIAFLEPTALTLAVLQNALELVIGLCLVMGIRMNITAWGTLLFMSFYTLLTFFLALFNPVSDCGCFGDCFKLTNWQTFFKNLALLAATLAIFRYRRCYKPFRSAAAEWLCVALFFIGSFWLSSYCYRHLPPVDCMPYHVGQNIPQAMAIPDDAPHDEYKTVLIYEKDGKQKEFSDTDFPWQDSSWKFVDSKSTLVKRGYAPPIYNFSMAHPTLGDITDSVLACEYAFLMVAPKLEKISTKNIGRMKELADFAQNHGYTFLGLTSSTQEAVSAFAQAHSLNFTLCSADETTLKSMVRAHPGLMLLYHGTVVGKWSHRDLPSPAEMKSNLLAESINLQRKAGERHAMWAFTFAGAGLLLLLTLGSHKKRK